MKILSFFLSLISFFLTYGQEDFYFIKTLNGESFETDLIPSLKQNVSFIRAVDSANNKIEYSIESNEFYADKYDGRIFLIARLQPNFQGSSYEKIIQISCSNGVKTIHFSNKIRIFNSYRTPKITNTLFLLEIEEGKEVPFSLTYKNGSLYELNVRNPYQLDRVVSLSCDQSFVLNSCDVFKLIKNESKSTQNEWIGNIRLNKRLDYSVKSLYFFRILASNGDVKTSKKTFQIRILPNLKTAAKLSEDSFHFSIPEEQPANTLIGRLKFNRAYDQKIQELFIASIVSDSDQLMANGILNQDVDCELNDKYFYIDQNNQIFSRLKIDRDSLLFTSLNGLVAIWLKISHRITGEFFNFSKIIIQILDINDNKPVFAINDENISVQNSQITQVYSSVIENEHGPVVFKSHMDQNILVYDLDFGENSTFMLELTNVEPNNSLTGCTMKKISSYLQLDQNIDSKSSLNLVNSVPFDFDTLNIRPNFNSHGIAYKNLNISLVAYEKESYVKLTHEPLNLILKIQDTNDNRPVFNQEVFYIYVSNFTIDKSDQTILKFDVTDHDIGVYGIQGLKCFVLGAGSEKFGVDAVQKKVFIKYCGPYCYYEKFMPSYHLILMCKDNNGDGNVAFSNLIINSQQALRPSLRFPVNTYYILASGPNSIEIPELILRPKNLRPNTKLEYIVQPELSKLFNVDDNGVFKIVANNLDVSKSINQNGTFLVPILINDQNGHSQLIHVIVQISNYLKQHQCPRISENAICRFSINRESFDPKLIRFCFYGASPTARNMKFSADPFYNKILYSLTFDSPQYLYIDSRDGCVKILPSFNLKTYEENFISYSIGVFNPHYPECIGISKRNCLITIENTNDNAIKCSKKYQIIDNSTSYKMDAYSSSSNSILHYTIVREERTKFDGTYETITNLNNFFYDISSNNGFIQLKKAEKLANYRSILLFIKVKDMSFYSAETECLVDFRYCNLESKKPKFIGFGLRHENICEDIPKNSLILSLRSFDPSQSNKNKICYSLDQNSYFSLKNHQPSQDGDVILRDKIDLKDLKLSSANTYVNFTAYLTDCHSSVVLSKQLVKINVLNVNKYAPRLVIKNHIVIIDLSINKSIPSFDVVDHDLSPYDYFECKIENNDKFALLNNNEYRKVFLTYKNLLSNQYPNEKFTDLVARCCDNSLYWTENACNSVPKCSLSLFRVSFVKESIACLNDGQAISLDKDTQILTELASVECASNLTQMGITYQLLTKTKFFDINKTTGAIFLLSNFFDTNYHKLEVLCSNGINTTKCHAEFFVKSSFDYRPVWIHPNPENFHHCLNLFEDTAVGSLIVRVKSLVPDMDLPITYSFVTDGKFVSSLLGFELKNYKIGDIFLTEQLNRTESIHKELTLAASITNPVDNSIVTTYQYLCINILPSTNYQPCFRNLPNNDKWPYEIDLKTQNTECFPNQNASIFNKDFFTPQVFYYIITSSNVSDAFYLDAISGLLCRNKSFSFQAIKDLILKSSNSYIDEFSNLSYNLKIIATKRPLSNTDLNSIVFDEKNCSFNFFKLILGKIDHVTKIKFTPEICQAVLSFDKIRAIDQNCLFKFNFQNPKLSNIIYTYRIEPKNNPIVTSIFGINSTTDCLKLNLESGISKISYLNKHEFTVYVNDYFGNSDSIDCKIYGIKGCNEKCLLLSSNKREVTLEKTEKFDTFLNETLTIELQKIIEIVRIGLIDVTNLIDKDKDIKFRSINSLIEFSVYDTLKNKFLSNTEFISIINSNSRGSNAKELSIKEAISSCPIIRKDSVVGRKTAVGLVSFFLGLLFLVIPALAICYLCWNFKKLKNRDSRVILNEQIIPIEIEPQLFSSFASNDLYLKPTNLNEQIFDDSNRSCRNLMPQYGTKSFKPIEKGSANNSDKTIKIRENIRQVKDDTQIEQTDNSTNKFLEEINDIGIVYLDQSTYDYYDQTDSVLQQTKEKLV